MTGIIIAMFITAITWGGYPLLLRSGGAGSYGPLMLGIGALIPVSIYSAAIGGHAPSFPVIIRFGVAGVLIGVGFITFPIILESKLLDVSVSAPIIDAGLLLVTTIGAIVCLGEGASLQKIFFIAVLVVGIIGLNRS